MRVRFIHTGDWQLGKPFGRFSERARPVLQAARLEAVGRLADIALKQGAVFVVVSGDVFDSPTPERSLVCQALAWIGKIPAPVIIIPGNHDHAGPGSVWEAGYFEEERNRLAPNLTVVTEARPVELEEAVLLCCPLQQRQPAVNPAGWLADPDLWNGLSKDKPRVVVAHGSTQTFDSDEEQEGETEWSSFLNLEVIPEGVVDYVALGDWHGIKQVGPVAWYSGALEPDRFPRSSSYRSGSVLVVELDGRGGAVRVDPVVTGKVVWEQLVLELDPATGIGPLEQVINAKLGNAVGEHVLELTLKGSLGLEDYAELEPLMEGFAARALELRWHNCVLLAPTSEDLAALTARVGDPMVAAVAERLRQGVAEGSDEDQFALVQLYRLVRELEGGA